MPGPNSAPNGDARLVKGYSREEFVWVERRDDKGRKILVQVSLRDYLAGKNRLRTGKTV